MSAPDLNAIRARAAAATKGPWYLDAGVDNTGTVFVGNRADGREYGLWEIVLASGDPLGDLTPEAAKRELANCEFIAHARQDIPDLCDEVERLRSIVAGVQAALADHPKCDKYEPDDVISCGWKKAVADVQRAVEGVEL